MKYQSDKTSWVSRTIRAVSVGLLAALALASCNASDSSPSSPSNYSPNTTSYQAPSVNTYNVSQVRSLVNDVDYGYLLLGLTDADIDDLGEASCGIAANSYSYEDFGSNIGFAVANVDLAISEIVVLTLAAITVYCPAVTVGW